MVCYRDGNLPGASLSKVLSATKVAICQEFLCLKRGLLQRQYSARSVSAITAGEQVFNQSHTGSAPIIMNLPAGHCEKTKG